MGMMMYLMVGGTAILLIPSVTAQSTNRDMWLSPIFSSLTGFLMVWVAWKLYQLYPRESVIGASEKILGPTLGKILSFPFLFYLLHSVGLITREYGEFVVGAFFQETPLIVVMGSIILVCSFAVRGGIEVVARCTQIFLPLILLFSFVMILLSLSDWNLNNILPIMQNGWMPILKGSMVPDIWFITFIYTTFFFPFLNASSKALKGAAISVFALMVTMVITSLICLFVLGSGLTEKFTFPVYTVGRYISIAGFLEHLDAVILAIWVGGGFIQISMWYYTIVLGTARWLNLSDHRSLVFPLGFLILVVSIWITPNLQNMMLFFSTTLILFCFIIVGAYPIFLLCVAGVKKKAKKGDGNNS